MHKSIAIIIIALFYTYLHLNDDFMTRREIGLYIVMPLLGGFLILFSSLVEAIESIRNPNSIVPSETVYRVLGWIMIVVSISTHIIVKSGWVT